MILMVAYILGATEFRQLFRINEIFSHYNEHKATSPGLSLSDFLALHYITGDENAADNEREKDLPFKSESETADECEHMNADQSRLVISETQIEKSFTEYSIFVPSAGTCAVWHPPKQS